MVKRLWAPWRIDYILGERENGCVFCRKFAESSDAENFVVYRGERAGIIMNIHPYTNGHIMIIPYRHAGELDDLEDEELAEMMFLTRKGVQMLRRAMQPHGFNIGLNIGAAAGAGIGDHLHIHVVPRWQNDTNFMPVLADVRVIPESLNDTYKRLREALQEK